MRLSQLVAVSQLSYGHQIYHPVAVASPALPQPGEPQVSRRKQGWGFAGAAILRPFPCLTDKRQLEYSWHCYCVVGEQQG